MIIFVVSLSHHFLANYVYIKVSDILLICSGQQLAEQHVISSWLCVDGGAVCLWKLCMMSLPHSAGSKGGCIRQCCRCHQVLQRTGASLATRMVVQFSGDILFIVVCLFVWLCCGCFEFNVFH